MLNSVYRQALDPLVHRQVADWLLQADAPSGASPPPGARRDCQAHPQVKGKREGAAAGGGSGGGGGSCGGGGGEAGGGYFWRYRGRGKQVPALGSDRLSASSDSS